MSKKIPKAQQLTSANWVGNASAGVVAGFFLSLAVCGVFAHFGPGAVGGFSAQAQVTMWLMAPVWALILSFCFLFRTALRAWLWLGGTSLALWVLLFFRSTVVSQVVG